jgi:Domain of unknown function (DUF4169)
MATIINLRQARKARDRAKREEISAEQRARFGRPGAEREHTAATEALNERRLDGARREVTSPATGSGGNGPTSAKDHES